MFKQLGIAFAFLSLTCAVAQAQQSSGNCPTPSLRRRQQADADFTLDSATLTSKLFCVGGIENAVNPFLLVPGSQFETTPNTCASQG